MNMIAMKQHFWWIDKKKSTYSSNKNSTASYSSLEYEKSMFNGYCNRLTQVIAWEKCKNPYEGLIIAEARFQEPYPICADTDVIALEVMRLLMKSVYNTEFEFAKFTIGYIMKVPTGHVSFIIGKAISLNYSCGNAIPNMDVYAKILQLCIQIAERYENDPILGVFIRVYHAGMQENKLPLSNDEINTQIWQLMNSGIGGGEPQEVKAMGRKRGYPNHIPALKPTSKERLPFIVADMETVFINDVHVPYAAGFLVVNPGEDVGAKPDHSIEIYYSEDYNLVIPEFEERSQKVLFDFLERLAVVSAERKIRTVYFHNFSRFDGIILLNYYASHGDRYSFKPLMRNHRLYELAVYRGKKRVFRLRDSYTILPSTLATLGRTLCPQLGPKGSIQHDEVLVSNLMILSPKLKEYLRQDILLLGGVMVKAQEIYWTQYKVDIENCLTLSALAMNIYRMNYYDPKSFPIHIPSRNEDTFIRRGYYGGHADVYKPYGENLYYYDVNSLYPYIMKTFPMPGGVPVWHGNLEGQELSNLYGFIEAYVVCPSKMTRPFLPYKDHNKTLLFPTGKFVGVYFSEELIYAHNLGYKILPLRGYLFEKKPSPFDSFVSSIFGRRQEAKKTGNEAMAYGYKILMNSLYGRFGINPESTITEVCERKRYDYLTQSDHFISGDKLSDNYYIVSYVSNTGDIDDSDWNPKKISAVQLSAAITACSRIHMYKYISRPDCYYTDTDSAILGSPLPEDEISSIELGKLKIENFVKKGIFLAPKSYSLKKADDGEIMKHKGLAKDFVNARWFESQYADLSQTKQVAMTSNFKIDWITLKIVKKYYLINLGIKVGTKRIPVYDNNDVWVDTQPKDVIDLGGEENSILKFELKNLQNENALIKEKLDKKDQEYASMQSEIAKLREKRQLPEEPVMRPLTESPTGLEQPTLDKHPTKPKPKPKPEPKAKKPKGKKPKGPG